MNIKRSIASITACVMVGIASIAYADTPTITDVTAQQRYPWNGKVDISYTITGDIAAKPKQQALSTSLKVTAIDMVAHTTNTATQLSGDLSLDEGTHAIVWDMNADGLTFKSSNVVFMVACETTNALYCVIDLSEGANATSYPVTYMAEPPNGGFNVDEYKTTKLVLRRLEAGTFIMGEDQNNESHRVTLTKPFFCGLFEVTQKQYNLVDGVTFSSGDTLPVNGMSYRSIKRSFIVKFRARTGLDFDLPTEAQWEYACRAGTTTKFSYGNSANGNYMWYSGNSDGTLHSVGLKSANPWGLYDMHGNVREWCLDFSGYNIFVYGTDPMGTYWDSDSGEYRDMRGGNYATSWGECTSFYRYGYAMERSGVYAYEGGGFRLVRTLSK